MKKNTAQSFLKYRKLQLFLLG